MTGNTHEPDVTENERYHNMSNGYGSFTTNSQRSSSYNYQHATAPSTPAYEEFFGGTVECPSCSGAGRIPREKENELVALIPFSDHRLKPRRTKCYVALAVCIAVTIAGLLIFFLFPRSIQLESDVPNLKPDHLYVNTSLEIVNMIVTNAYNISNANFFPVEVNQLAVTVLFDQKVVSSHTNSSVIRIPIRTFKSHYVTLNITFAGDEGYIAYFCDASARYGHTLLLPFQSTATISYLGRTEESTLTTYQHVQCSKTKTTL